MKNDFNNKSELRFRIAKVHGANMGPIWVLSAPDGPHVGPMNLAIRVSLFDTMSLASSWIKEN